MFNNKDLNRLVALDKKQILMLNDITPNIIYFEYQKEELKDDHVVIDNVKVPYTDRDSLAELTNRTPRTGVFSKLVQFTQPPYLIEVNEEFKKFKIHIQGEVKLILSQVGMKGVVDLLKQNESLGLKLWKSKLLSIKKNNYHV